MNIPDKPSGTPVSPESATDINRQILSELRRMRRSNEIAACFAVVTLVFISANLYWRIRPSLQMKSKVSQEVARVQKEDQSRQAQTQRQSPSAQTQPAKSPWWDEVSEATGRLDFPKAISLLESVIAKQPNDYYSHAYLGNVYVTIGNFTNAEKEYIRACEFYPDEINEKALAAIRKRLARERGSPLLSN